MDKVPTIRIKHARACGLCVSGQTHVAERYGVDYFDFCQNGVPALPYAEHTNPLIRKIAQLAIKEWEQANGQGK